MSKRTYPVTAAIRTLRSHQITFSRHLYDYEDKGGTRQAARALGIATSCVVKTLIMEDNQHDPLIVLVQGNQQVSTKELARQIGVKSVTAADPQIANKYSGYQVGGISPFGIGKSMPVYMESSILDLPLIYINGGKRGFLIGISPTDVKRILQPIVVQVGIDD